MATITAGPISGDNMVERLRQKEAGCVLSYVGIVREASAAGQLTQYLLFPASGEAEDKLTAIEQEAQRRFQIQEALISHRTGQFAVTDVILVLAVSAAHRQAAFAACAWIVDEVKKVHASWAQEVMRP